MDIAAYLDRLSRYPDAAGAVTPPRLSKEPPPTAAIIGRTAGVRGDSGYQSFWSAVSPFRDESYSP